MNKMVIKFEHGQYSPVKDSFKKIFAGKFHWDKKQAWVSPEGKGYVKASKKMESGEAVTFLIECEDKLKDKFITFCADNKIVHQSVNNFDNIDVIEAKIEPEHKTGLVVKLDRAGNFQVMLKYRRDLSPEFIKRWGELLKEDDDKFNSTDNTIKEEDMFT